MFDQFVSTPAAGFSAVPGAAFGSGARVPRILRPREVAARVALSLAHIYRLIAEGRFPPFDALGPRASGLPEHVLDAFLAERMAARATMAPLGLRPPLPRWEFTADKVPARCGISLLRRPQVEALSGLPNSTFYPLIPQGHFPAQVSLGPCAARWVAHEVAAWACSRPPALSGRRVAERAERASGALR